jgi:hypothetical protein
VSAAPASMKVVTQPPHGYRATSEAATNSTDAVQEKVREFLEDELMGEGDVVFKVTVLRTLAGYFTDTKNPDYQHMSAYRDAVSKWHGCHLVLVVLRQELAKVDGPSRDIVLGAVQFLTWWNRSSATNRDEMSKVNGVETVVSVMETYLNDRRIQDWSISCLLNFTRDNDARRREELVKANAVVPIFRAMTDQTNAAIQKHCVLVLGRLCDSTCTHLIDGLVEIDALEALVKVYKAHRNSSDPSREEICASCRKWMTKLVV